MGRGALSEAVSPAQKGSNPQRLGTAQQRSLLNVDDLAQWFGVEAGFVRRLVAERRVPFVKIGKYVRFDAEEIAVWIDAQRVRTEATSARRRTFRD